MASSSGPGVAELRQPPEVDDIAHGEFAAGLGLLRQPGELAGAVASGPLRQGATSQRDLAAVQRLQTGQGAQQGGLAGAVGADDGGPAGRELHGEAMQDRAVAQTDLQRVGSDHPTISRRRSSHSR
jgi:hypothetical protein